MIGRSNIVLGNTGLTVSRLGFGTVYMGPDGDNLTTAEGARLLLYGFELGIHYWDTSDDYGSHPHVALALRQLDRSKVVISSKTRLPSAKVSHILEELETDCLDVLLAHEVTRGDCNVARDVFRSWHQDRASGTVRAVGLSTHSAEVASIAAEWPEVEVLMLPINASGYCLPDQPIEGGIEKMRAAAEKAYRLGKGIVAMKVMELGKLGQDPGGAISFVSRLPYIHTLCIGMRSRSQIDQNARLVRLEG